MSLRQTITCSLKGHLWSMAPGQTTPDPRKGSYWVHNLCFRCGRYRVEKRYAVPFHLKEQ